MRSLCVRLRYQDQCRSLTLVRKDDPDGLGKLNVAAARGALRRIDRAFQAFFRRRKKNEKPRVPAVPQSPTATAPSS